MEKIIEEIIRNPLPRDYFKNLGLKIIAETAQHLRDEGISDRIIAEITAMQLARLNRPSVTELAKQLFPIEPMPLPNALCYFWDEKG